MITEKEITKLSNEDLTDKLIAFSMYISKLLQNVLEKRIPGAVCTAEELRSVKDEILRRLTSKEIYILLGPTENGNSRIIGVVSNEKVAKEWVKIEKAAYPDSRTLQEHTLYEKFVLDKLSS